MLIYIIQSPENGELDSSQQLNLLSLTAMTGDKQLLEKETVILMKNSKASPSCQGVQKLLSTLVMLRPSDLILNTALSTKKT